MTQEDRERMRQDMRDAYRQRQERPDRQQQQQQKMPDRQQQQKMRQMSPEERGKLRRDIEAANKDLKR